MFYWIKRELFRHNENRHREVATGEFSAWELAERIGDHWYFVGYEVSELCVRSDKIVPIDLVDPDGKPYTSTPEDNR